LGNPALDVAVGDRLNQSMIPKSVKRFSEKIMLKR